MTKPMRSLGIGPLQIGPLQIGPLQIDPPVLQAPMAGYTNFAYRQMVREFGGCGLQATEMISARGFDWMDQHESKHPDRLWGVRDEPRPLAVQIWDNDPETLARVGATLAHGYGVSVVDINFGCPVRRVTESARSGSYLLRDPDRVGAIVERVARACAPVPVTAKIRLGINEAHVNAIEVAKVVESAGAAGLTVHGRTADRLFKGQADWERIAEIKRHLNRIPLIGNGDLTCASDVVEALRTYGVDGVMVARAALGKPWLFQQVRAVLLGEPEPPDPPVSEQRRCLLRLHELVVDRFGEAKGVMLMRKYGCCFAQGMSGSRQFRTHVAKAIDSEDFRRIVQEYFPCENE